MPPGGTPFCGCTQGLWATEEEDALEELLITTTAVEEVAEIPAIEEEEEELLGVVAIEEDETSAELMFIRLLELLGSSGTVELLEITEIELLDVLEWPEPPELLNSGGFSSLLVQAKKTPPVEKASKNKTPNILFILQSPNIYLLIPMGK